MWFVTAFSGHENAIAIVSEYDQKLLLPLLTKATKLLCANVKKNKDLQFQSNVQTTSTNVNI
jgi:hypothetical protein